MATGGTSHHQAGHRNRQFTVCSKAVLSCREHTERTNTVTGGTSHHQARHLNRVHRVLQGCPLDDTHRTSVATGGTSHHQAEGSGGRPAPHNPVPDCTWTEGLCTARSNAEEGDEEEEEEEDSSNSCWHSMELSRVALNFGQHGNESWVHSSPPEQFSGHVSNTGANLQHDAPQPS